MSLTTTGKNTAVEAVGAVATLMRLYDDGGAEVLDYDGLSQDKTISWGSAINGTISIGSSVSFKVQAGVTLAAISFRSSDGNTEYGRDEIAVENQETYANDGTYNVTSATLTIS